MVEAIKFVHTKRLKVQIEATNIVYKRLLVQKETQTSTKEKRNEEIYKK